VFGYLAVNSAITALVEGLIIVELKITLVPEVKDLATASSTFFQVVGLPLANGPFKRAPSYKLNTEDCTRALVAPWLTLINHSLQF
jgi:hypothetical protein